MEKNSVVRMCLAARDWQEIQANFEFLNSQQR
jgi:hypothetical protein